MALIKCVDRYVGLSVIRGILLAWAVLITLLGVLGFVGELRSSQGSYGPLQAIWFVLMTTPRQAYQTFAVAALVGALLGAGGLAAHHELVAFRAAGVSRLRLSIAAILGCLLLLVPVMWLGEYLAPQVEQQARTYRLLHQDGRIHLGGTGGLWVREGNDIVNVRSPIITTEGPRDQVRFEDVVVYRLGDKRTLENITRARAAVPGSDGWSLKDVRQLAITDQAINQSASAEAAWNTKVDPGLLDSAVTRPRYLSIRALNTYVNYLESNGQDSRQYGSALWEKILFPVTVLALILAGMPFVFGSARQQNLGLRLFIGIALGTLYTLFSRSFSNFGDAYGLPVVISSAIPIVLLVWFAFWALRRTP